MQHVITIIMLCLTVNIVAMDTNAYSDKQCKEALYKIANTWLILEHDLSQTRTELERFHEWGKKNNLQLLDEAYSNLLCSYRHALLSNKTCEALYDALCPILDRYAEINPKDALAFLNARIKQNVLNKFASQRCTKKYPFKLLQILKKIDPKQFELTVSKVIEKKFELLFRSALAHPDLAHALDDERLSLPSLVQTAFNDHPNKHHYREVFLLAPHHTTFEGLVIPAISEMTKESFRNFSYLFQSPSERIRKATFQEAFSYIINNEQMETYEAKSIITDMLQHENDSPLERKELYKKLLNRFKEVNYPINDFGIQRIMKNLLKNPIDGLLNSVVATYFKTPINPDPNPFIVINQSLESAIENKTVSLTELHNMLSLLEETGLEPYFYPDTITRLKKKLLLDENLPIKALATLLDEFLYEQNKENEEVKRMMEQLPPSPFANYATLLLTVFSHSQESPAYLTAKEQLTKLVNDSPEEFSNHLLVHKLVHKSIVDDCDKE